MRRSVLALLLVLPASALAQHARPPVIDLHAHSTTVETLSVIARIAVHIPEVSGVQPGFRRLAESAASNRTDRPPSRVRRLNRLSA